MQQPSPPPSSSGTVVILAALAVASSAVVLFLAALLGPNLLVIAGIGMALVAFVGLHFWLWGRSMPAAEPDDDQPS